MDLKNQHELALIKRALESRLITYKNLRKGNDGSEPDCLIENGGITIGIEITVAYPNNDYAKTFWKAARDKIKGITGTYKTGIIEEFDTKVICNALSLAAKKETKNYEGVERLILLLHIDSFLSDDEIVEEVSKQVSNHFSESRFDERWIGKYCDGGVYSTCKV